MLTGYKFESIRTLNNENVIAWEMLSTTAPHVDIEALFESMTTEERFAHFIAQLRHTKGCPQSGKYYLNAASDLLLKDEFIPTLLAHTPLPGNIVIELTDLDHIVQLDDDQSQRLAQQITRLHEWKIEVWADDVYEALLPRLLARGYAFHGVKIDKHTFWSGRTQREWFLQLTHLCKQLAEKVLVEGIETSGDYALACASAADYGQGYLWNN